MFHDREDAAHALASRLQHRPLRDPLILGIPRGGLILGVALARDLAGELDVVLSRKLRVPGRAEVALGAVAEDGQVYLDQDLIHHLNVSRDYVIGEIDHQREELARRSHLYRQVRPAAPITGRTVIVVDDGLATGSTMIAALRALREQQPAELICAVPVASPERLTEVGRWCDEVICVEAPAGFTAVSQYYRAFPQISDEEVVQLLHLAYLRSCAAPTAD